MGAAVTAEREPVGGFEREKGKRRVIARSEVWTGCARGVSSSGCVECSSSFGGGADRAAASTYFTSPIKDGSPFFGSRRRRTIAGGAQFNLRSEPFARCF